MSTEAAIVWSSPARGNDASGLPLTAKWRRRTLTMIESTAITSLSRQSAPQLEATGTQRLPAGSEESRIQVFALRLMLVTVAPQALARAA
jgi:hypothetical protein